MMRDCTTSACLIEFIPMKPLVATGSGAPGSGVGHRRVPSPDHGPLASPGGSGPARCDSASPSSCQARSGAAAAGGRIRC